MGVGVPEPERDDGNVDSGGEEVHGTGVPQRVHGDVLGGDAGTGARRGDEVLGEAVLEGVARQRLSVRTAEQCVTGAALMCFASGVDEAEAVRETVAILKEADLAPLEVQGLGTLEERRKAGDEIGAEEVELMDRALAENSVVVAQMTPFYE